MPSYLEVTTDLLLFVGLYRGRYMQLCAESTARIQTLKGRSWFRNGIVIIIWSGKLDFRVSGKNKPDDEREGICADLVLSAACSSHLLTY